MGDFLERVGSLALRPLNSLVAWHLRSWQETWDSAWYGTHRELRLLGLGVGLFIACILVPPILHDIGLVRGISYFIAVYLAISNGTFLKIVRVRRNERFPLGIVAPVFILIGVIGSSAIRPLIGEAKEAAMAKDFIGALVILGVFAIMMLWFRVWQSGNPYRH